MAQITIDVKAKQRIDTSSNWTSANPGLLKGELGIESDTRRIKIGDGVTPWNTLSYADSLTFAGKVLSDFPQLANDEEEGVEEVEYLVGDMLKSIYDSDGDGKVDRAVNADTVNQLTVEKAVPAGAVFTDTVYSHPSSHPANMIEVEDSEGKFTATDVEGVLEELFTSVSDGKTSVADAITDMGVEASASDEFFCSWGKD